MPNLRSSAGTEVGHPPGNPVMVSIPVPEEAKKRERILKQEEDKKHGKWYCIADLVISIVCIPLGFVNGVLGAGWPYAGAQFLLYTVSVVASILVLTLPKKQRALLFWFIWSTIRFGELLILAFSLSNIDLLFRITCARGGACTGTVLKSEEAEYGRLRRIFFIWLIVWAVYTCYWVPLLMCIWSYYKAIKKPLVTTTRPRPGPGDATRETGSEIPFYAPGFPSNRPLRRPSCLPVSQWDIEQAEKAKQEQNKKDTANS